LLMSTQSTGANRPAFNLRPRPDESHAQAGYRLREVSMAASPVVNDAGSNTKAFCDLGDSDKLGRWVPSGHTRSVRSP
jgi:hypothetical protein